MSVQAHSSGVETLHRMGYAQELVRRMSGFSNFAVSFTIISILAGCLTLFYFGMSNGGPAVITIGWPVVGVMVILVGLAMAEVCSSYPTAGGLYYWAAKLGGKSSAGWSWITGWFNLLGQVAVTAGIDFGLAFFANYFLSLFISSWPNPLNAATDIGPRISIIAVYAAVLFIHGLLNTFGVSLVALLNDISVWWHIAGVLIIVGVLFLFSKYHQSPSYVFTKFVNLTGFSFAGASIFVFLTGLLMAQYTFTGYDASAHMTEETRNAAISGPRGIVWSIIISLVAGWILLIGVTQAINDADYANIVGALGAAPAVIFQAGPWQLGRWSPIVGWIAVVWIACIAVLFVLPQAAPGNTLTTFNYAPVAVAVVLIFAGGYWFLSAKNWFKGPKVQGSADELARIEADLEAVGAPMPVGAPSH